MNLAKIAAIAICLPFIREATARTGDLLSLKEGEEHWSVMRGETEIARYAKTLSKAGDASRVELVLTNNAIIGKCTAKTGGTNFNCNVTLLKRRHLIKSAYCDQRLVIRWTTTHEGALPVEEPEARLLRFGEGDNMIRYLYNGKMRINPKWQDVSSQHFPLEKTGEGEYGGKFLVAFGESFRDVELAALLAGERLSAEISTAKNYNLFETGEELQATVYLHCHNKKENECIAMKCVVRDWDGEIVYSKRLKLALDEEGRARHKLRFRNKAERGIYFIEARAGDNCGNRIMARTNIAQLPRYEYETNAPSIFGLAAYWPIPDEKAVQSLMDRMGVRYLRNGDTRIQNKPRIAFHHSNPNYLKLTGAKRREWIAKELETCVERGNPCWEMGNESNMSTGGIALSGGGIGKALMAKPYAEFVRDTRQIMDELGYSKKVKLLSVGVAGFDRKFFGQIRTHGAWEDLDGFCLHPGRGCFTPDYPYIHPETEKGEAFETEEASHADRMEHSNFWNYYGSVRDCARMIADEGKPLYLTEIYTPTYPNSWWEDSLRDSADNTMLSYILAMTAKVKIAFYYQLFDTVWFDKLGANPRNREYYFGLLNRDLSFKPAMMAYIATAEALDGAKFDGWLKPLNETSHGVLFSSAKRGDFVCLWDRSEGYKLTQKPPKGKRYISPEPWKKHWTKKTEVSLPVKPGAFVVDSTGRRLRIECRDGKALLQLDGSPVILFGLDKGKLK